MPPVCSACQLKVQTGEMISETAIVSPIARPKPSITAPIMPPRP